MGMKDAEENVKAVLNHNGFRPGHEPFKQENPKMQAKVILGSLEGWLSNFEEGITNKEKFCNQVKLHMIRLSRLHEESLKDSWENNR